MPTISFPIPYAGTISSNASLQYETDCIYVGNNKFLMYFQQQNQGLGFISVFQATNFDTNIQPVVTLGDQKLVHVGNISSVKMFPIATDRVLLIVDKTCYILEISGTTVAVVKSEIDFLESGVQSRGLTDNTNMNIGRGYFAKSIKNNELLMVENENPNAKASVNDANNALYRFNKIVYNPLTNTLTKTRIRDFNVDLNIQSNQTRANIVGEILPIPGSTNYFMYFAFDVSPSSAGLPSIRYSARINEDGIEQELYNVPAFIPSFNVNENSTNTTPIAAVAMNEDTIVYLSSPGRMATIYNGERFNAIQLVNLNSWNSKGNIIHNIIPLDENHFVMNYTGNSNYTMVFRVDSPQLIQTRANFSNNTNFFTCPNTFNQALRSDVITSYSSNKLIHFNGAVAVTRFNPDINSNSAYVDYIVRRIDLS